MERGSGANISNYTIFKIARHCQDNQIIQAKGGLDTLRELWKDRLLNIFSSKNQWTVGSGEGPEVNSMTRQSTV